MANKKFSFVWRCPESDEWSYCYGNCVFVGIISRNEPAKLRFLVKPEEAEGHMPYHADGVGHVELFEDIVYFKRVTVDQCACHAYTDNGPCGYYVWFCEVDRIVSKECPCEA